MDEPSYRKLVDTIFSRIDAAFEDVDPDLAESALSQGALTITFAEGQRIIISPQPPVRQIWVAFRDRAWHLNLEASTGKWLDDRGQGVELYSLIERLTQECAGVSLRIPRG